MARTSGKEMGTVRQAGIQERQDCRHWEKFDKVYVATVELDNGTMLEFFNDPSLKEGDRVGCNYRGIWIVTERLPF